MTRDDLAVLCDARDTICRFCQDETCDSCMVTKIINDAHNDVDEHA